MILTLEVTGPQADPMGTARRKVFGVDGGTIGRLPDNDWVLADPFVSGRHAIIHFVDGAFHIEDTSRNGVFVNSPDDRVVRGRPHPIQSGDRILIDPYEIAVQVTAEPRGRVDSPQALDNPFLDPDRSLSDPLSALSPDPMSALGFAPDRPPPPRGPTGPGLAGGSPMSAHYAPPKVEPGSSPELIPSNWQDASSIFPSSQARPAATPRPPSKPEPPPPVRQAASSSDAGISALLQAAGLGTGTEVPPELARDLGQIFRVVVSGVMDVLKARQRTKDEFGLGMTTFKRTDNNPLKFSGDVEDALHNLFVKKHNTTYLGPVEAFEDAFEDMRNHQIAMLVGVRVAFEAMLSEFHPDHLQEQFDRQLKKGALVSIPARLRYWDLYRDWIHDMVRDADTSFRELFGDEFARAYEDQLKRLKSQGRAEKG